MLQLGNHFSDKSQLFSVSWIYEKLLNDNFSNPCRCDFNKQCAFYIYTSRVPYTTFVKSYVKDFC